MSSQELSSDELDNLTTERLHSAAMWRYWNDSLFHARCCFAFDVTGAVGAERTTVIRTLALDDAARERFGL